MAKMVTCDWCHGKGKITEIVEHRGSWVDKPRRCDQCGGFGKVAGADDIQHFSHNQFTHNQLQTPNSEF